ncbi:hypothetical protein SGPA1_20812 [Streptomyces misionensis JCM 4497]
MHWRNLPERFGPWKTVYERRRLWSADGTWERLLQQIQAEADAAGEIDRDVSVDSTIVQAHQHAAGARNDPPPALASRGPAVLVDPAGRAVQDLVAAAVRDAAELLDVDVDEFAGTGAFVAADRLPGGPVQRGQSRQAVADERMSPTSRDSTPSGPLGATGRVRRSGSAAPAACADPAP